MPFRKKTGEHPPQSSLNKIETQRISQVEQVESALHQVENYTRTEESIDEPRIEKLRGELGSIPPEEATLPDVAKEQAQPLETRMINNQPVQVHHCAKVDVFPALGVADLSRNYMFIRRDLPPAVQQAVKAHEEGHLRFQTQRELVAGLYGIVKEPLNSLHTFIFCLTNAEQRNGLARMALENLGLYKSLQEKFNNPFYLPKIKEILNNPKEIEQIHHRMIGSGEEFGYEILTEEYINKLADYITTRVEQMPPNKGMKILELGAGKGRLSYFLKEKLREKGLEQRIKIIPTSYNPEGEIPIQPVISVEMLSYQDALAKHQPDIVISSWMPSGEDWTETIRQTPTVQEYLMIGPANGETCGSINTWNKNEYTQDSFERYDLEELNELQVNYLTYSQHLRDSNPGVLSKTVSFRKTSN
jgi:hypothetical protein